MKTDDIIFNGKTFCRIVEIPTTLKGLFDTNDYSEVSCIITTDWCEYINDTKTTNQRQIIQGWNEVKEFYEDFQNVTEIMLGNRCE